MTLEFVGREAELYQLEGHLTASIGGRGRVVLVSGEAGIGKTFLVDRFLTLAARRYPQVSIAAGQCSERLGHGEPYLPLSEALGMLLSRAQEKSPREKVLAIALETAPSWLGAVPAVGSALAASFETAQAVRDQFGGKKSPVTAPDREHVLQEYTGVLTRLSQESPIVLFVDDLQWCDVASVDLLVHLSRRIGGSRILIVGTYRPSDVAVGRDGRPHPLQKATLDMQRYNACHEIALDRLGREECAALISREFPHNDFPLSLLDLLFEHTGGNALFVTEILRLLREAGLVEAQDGTWRLARQVADLPIPRSVESIVVMRIDRLEADLRRALRYASAEGERFLSTVLAQVAEVDELALEERLAVVERVHRLISSRGELEIGWELATVYHFTHILFQDELYGRLQPKERALVHRRTGLALEELYGDKAGQIASELALHFDEGRAYEKALKYSLLAAQAAKRLFAAKEAIDHYERAQRLLARLGGGELEQQLAVEEGLGDMRAVLGQHEEALGHYDRARELLVVAPAESDRVAGICRKTAMLYERTGEYDIAFQWLERGLGSVTDDSALEIARIRLAGAGIYSRQGKHRRALDWCRSGLAIARQSSNARVMAHATYLLGTIHGHLGRGEEEIACARESLAIYEELGDPAGQMKALNNLGVAQMEGGDWHQAIDSYRRGIALADRIGDVNNAAILTHNLGNILLEQGSLGAAVRAYERSLGIWEAIGFPFGVAASWSGLGNVYDECGEWERALDYLDRSERKFKEIQSDLFLPEVYRRQALVHLNTGRLEQARQLIERSVALAAELEMALERGISLRVSGQISLAHGMCEAAEAALRESLDILREQGNRYQMAETLYQLGCVYRSEIGGEDWAGGKEARATKAQLVLRKARDIFKRLGARRALARVEEAIHEGG
ncbi:MAG: tetratricopeptide repeat protein [Anaerolineae bacterium]|jgi:tetratricopeptide (TPR) repeat protein